MKRLAILALLAALPALAGCRRDLQPGFDDNRGDRPRPPALDAAGRRGGDPRVAAAINRRPPLTSLVGRGVIRMRDEPQRFRLGVNVEVWAEGTDGVLRIKAEKLAGQIQAFDLIMQTPDIELHIPTQHALYTGKVDDAGRLGMPLNPEEILERLLKPDTELTLRTWRPVRGRPGDAGPAFEDETGTLRVTLDRRGGLLASIELSDQAGQPAVVWTLSNYRPVNPGARGAGREAVYPYYQKIEWPRERRRVEVHFKQLQPNAPITDAMLEIAVPGNVRRLPLDEMRMEGDAE
nr:hypothetical protein [uncultured bacterium]